MKTRAFGKTGLEVSELVFGAGFVGGIIIHADDDTRRSVVKLALDGGINWIDTAASYGDRKSEEALGWLLKEIPEDARPYISTKFTLKDEASDGPFAEQIEASLETSLGLLQRADVELLQLHNRVGDGEGMLSLAQVLGDGGICDTLDSLQKRGLIKHAGFTALGEAAACHEVIKSGRMASAQVYYNMLNPSAGYPVPANWGTQDFDLLLDACAEHGVAAMNIRTFAGGCLTMAPEHGREIPITPNSSFGEERGRAEKVFAALGDEYGTPSQTALRFSLSHAKMSCVVIGLAEISHLEEALAAQAMGPLPEEAVAKLQALWAADFA